MADAHHPPTFLIDANIFLEVIFRREYWPASMQFLNRVAAGHSTAFISAFELHGIEALLSHRNQFTALDRFLRGVESSRGLSVYYSTVREEHEALQYTKQFSLDFDDSLQYAIAKTLNLTLVSYDHDFDCTNLTRREPQDLIA
jgi:predicted nucleic acid-binding protein